MTGPWDDGALRAQLKNSPAPPAPALLAAVGGMKPVRPRARFGAFAAVMAAGLVWPVYSLLTGPFRPDLRALPPAWVLTGAALWTVAFLYAAAAALVPARQDVFPSARRAGRAASAALLAVFLFALLTSVEVPGVSLRPADVGLTVPQSWIGCGKFVLTVATLFLLAGAFALRRVLPVGARAVGLALGAAGGALGGLVLHFICPLTGRAHVLGGHVGATALAAVAGAALMSRLLGR